MKNKKAFGVAILGISITVFLALIPLLIFGDSPIGDKAFDGYYNYYLEGTALFKWILGIGLSITLLIVLKFFTKSLRITLYPTILSVILGIIIGLLFPVRVWGESIAFVYDFNTTVFLITLSVGIFISLIVYSTNLIKKG